METFKDTRLLNKVNEYGGLIESYGHAYMDIIDNHIIIIRCALDSIYKINTFEKEFIIIKFDIENSIPKIYLDKIIFNFFKSFYSFYGPKFSENFANYDIFKKNAQELLVNIKNQIKLNAQELNPNL